MGNNDRLDKRAAFELGVKHGAEMASESGSNDAGCDGWDGMLINADPQFVRDYFGWNGADSDDEAKELLAEYCKGCQSGADAAVGECEHETIDSLGYEVYDANSSESLDTFEEAAERIAEWLEDADQWATGEGDAKVHQAIRDAIDSVEQPEGGGIDALRAYAESVSEAVAIAMGSEGFAGHGNYRVSASDRSGIRVEVREIQDPE